MSQVRFVVLFADPGLSLIDGPRYSHPNLIQPLIWYDHIIPTGIKGHDSLTLFGRQLGTPSFSIII
jgi:hypothetical protein